MKAIILAPGYDPALGALGERFPTPMLPLLDRPFLQHVVEFLVGGGIDQLHFVLSHLPQTVESCFGDGRRWGAVFQYHLARDSARPFDAVKAIAPGNHDEPVLLLDASRLPADPCVCRPPARGDAMPLAFAWREQREGESTPALRFSGWIWVRESFLHYLPAGLDSEALESLCFLQAEKTGKVVVVPQPLSVETCGHLLRSQRRLLCAEFSTLMVTGREVEPGIWLSRNVSLPPSVKLVPPVYIGPNCSIARHVALGPNVAIGEGSVLDTRCSVRDSLVCPGSFVGESLELGHVVIDKNCLVNTRLGTTCAVSEEFIVGSLRSRPLHDHLARIFSRACAACLLVAACPLLLLTALWLKLVRSGPVLCRREFVRLPAPNVPPLWTVCRRWSFLPPERPARDLEAPPGCLRPLLLDVLPALVNIVKGELGFVGVRPRSAEQLDALPKDWKELVLRCKAGMVTEAFVQFGHSPCEEEAYCAEAVYSVRAGVRYDLTLMIKALGRLLRLRAAARSAPGEDRSSDGASRAEPERTPQERPHVIQYSSIRTAELETTSELSSLDRIRAFVESVCRELVRPPMPEQDAYKMVVAVYEMATNVMLHAYEGRTDGRIRFVAEVSAERVTIRICHQGKGFDPEAVAEPSLDGSREGGFGLYIIREYVDDVEYSSDERDVQCVSLTTNLPGEGDYGNRD